MITSDENSPDPGNNAALNPPGQYFWEIKYITHKYKQSAVHSLHITSKHTILKDDKSYSGIKSTQARCIQTKFCN